MQSGKLRHRITIQDYVEDLTDNGETVPTWSTWATRWALWLQLSGSERENEAEAIEGRQRHKFKLRKCGRGQVCGSGIKVDMRVSYCSRIFNIDGVTADPTDSLYEWLECTEIMGTV